MNNTILTVGLQIIYVHEIIFCHDFTRLAQSPAGYVMTHECSHIYNWGQSDVTLFLQLIMALSPTLPSPPRW